MLSKDKSRRAEALSILASTDGASSDFFERAVEALSIGLNSRWAVIGELQPSKRDIDVLAFWNISDSGPRFSYSLAGGPCEIVYQHGQEDYHHVFPNKVTELFPAFSLLQELGAEAYRGELFFNSHGQPIGHVVALYDKPEELDQDSQTFFRLVTQRIGAEYNRMQADKALRQSQSLLEALINNSPNHIVIKSIDGQFIYANKKISKDLADLGVTIDRLEGSQPDYPSNLAQMISDHDQQVIQTKSVVQREIVMDLAERSQTIWAIKFPIFNEEDEIEMIGGIGVDISEMKEMEARARENDRLRVLGQLTGGIAHDFNNILAIIEGNTDLLMDEVGHDHPRGDALIRACERGADLIQRLLSFARRQPLRPCQINVRQHLEQTLELAEAMLDERYQTRLSLAPGLPPVHADPGELENAVINLMINARDAMDEGGIIDLCASYHEPTSAGGNGADDDNHSFVEISLTDHGKGISEEILSHVFEPFFTTKEMGEGSGLGLSMVHGFARQSGGDVKIESKVGQGTKVSILLPVASQDQ